MIRIEPVPAREAAANSVTGARHGADEQNLHRNKRSIRIDLKHPQGNQLCADPRIECAPHTASCQGRRKPFRNLLAR